jgi:integrase
LGLWRIPKTKHGESHTIPLTQFALQLLEARFQDRTSEWVFPGKKPGTHLAEPKATWKAVLNEAKLKDLRIHDLRRTLGSYMAIGNQSLQIIGKALGHKSMTSTQVYARLANDPVRQGMEKAQVEIFSAAGLIVTVPALDAQSSDAGKCSE